MSDKDTELLALYRELARAYEARDLFGITRGWERIREVEEGTQGEISAARLKVMLGKLSLKLSEVVEEIEEVLEK